MKVEDLNVRISPPEEFGNEYGVATIQWRNGQIASVRLGRGERKRIALEYDTGTEEWKLLHIQDA